MGNARSLNEGKAQMALSIRINLIKFHIFQEMFFTTDGNE